MKIYKDNMNSLSLFPMIQSNINLKNKSKPYINHFKNVFEKIKNQLDIENREFTSISYIITDYTNWLFPRVNFGNYTDFPGQIHHMTQNFKFMKRYRRYDNRSMRSISNFYSGRRDKDSLKERSRGYRLENNMENLSLRFPPIKKLTFPTDGWSVVKLGDGE